MKIHYRTEPGFCVIEEPDKEKWINIDYHDRNGVNGLMILRNIGERMRQNPELIISMDDGCREFVRTWQDIMAGLALVESMKDRNHEPV